MNKQDSRFITSEKRIKEAFFGLLSRKSIDEIRTQEIIASAGINKSTFYSHYKDKYDLLDSLAA
ncbi:MAG: TetR/AcrR family transcriptional regulator, partial [Clostridiales bacterium]|nr:TetR/AcrR family transcriptional regulator [Clostridiales bacterium]